MTILSLADCCRHLAIDPKTLRRWLAQAPFTRQSHPQDARLKGLTEEQLRWLATAHHRHLARCLRSRPCQFLPPRQRRWLCPTELCEALQALRALPAQLAALQEQLADLTHQISLLAEPASTTRSRVGVTSKATNSRRRSRGRTKGSQQRRPSQAQVLALVEYAGEGQLCGDQPQRWSVAL